MKKAFYISLNEVRLYLIDKGDLAFSLLLPILTFALMYGAFGGQSTFNATASIVNQDNGPYSQQLIKQLDAVSGVTVNIISADDANTRLDQSDLLTAFIIPAGFSDNLSAGSQTEIIVKQRGNGGQEGQILTSILSGVVDQIDQAFQINTAVKNSLAGRNVSGDRINVVVQDQLTQQQKSPAVGVAETTVGGSTNFINQFLPGIVTMYVMFSLTLVSLTIVEERKRGTLERLLSTRLNVRELFLGKFLSIVARGFIQTLILLGLSYAVSGYLHPSHSWHRCSWPLFSPQRPPP